MRNVIKEPKSKIPAFAKASAGRQNPKLLVFLLIILAVAGFFRLWQLDSIPPGLYPDEAINGNEAISKPGQVFYPENTGREGLLINLIALSFSIFGISIWSLKIVSAIIGILTVLGLYLLVKELFSHGEARSRPVALLSSFFLAVSFWHVNFSRIGFRGILVPFILVFAFYFLLRAFRKKSLSDFIFSGIFWGLGFYTYSSFRLAIFILIIFLVLKLIEYFKQNPFQWNWKWYWKKMCIQDGWWKVDFLIPVMVLVALPLGLYFFQSPQAFVGRTAEVSIFSQISPLKAFGESFIKHLGMFNFYGDWNWRHNFSGSPQLFWPVGILFLIGLIISFRNKNIFLLSWFFIMLLPGILTYEGIPHALRTIGVVPVVYIFVGLGGWHLYQRLNKIIENKRLLIVLCFLFLAALIYEQYCRYFLNWANRLEVKDAFSADYVQLGDYLNSLPKGTPKYVVVNVPGVPVPWPDGIPMPAQTVMFVESTKYGRPQSTYLLPEDLEKIKIEKDAVIVKMKYE